MKVAIITNKILKYRQDFFDVLGNDCDLSVYSFHDDIKEGSYKSELLEKKLIGKFYSFKKFNLKILDQYDILVCSFDLRFLIFYRLLVSKYRHKTLLWGIGLSSQKGIRKKPFLDFIRIMLVNRFAGILIYSERVAKYYNDLGCKKIITAVRNSVKVSNDVNYILDTSEHNFIFVGSLHERKGIQIFFAAYAQFLIDYPDLNSRLFVIGDGYYKETLVDLAHHLKIYDNISFIGRVSDDKQLTQFYKKSIMSFSINQAGLSVLQSLGNGVPFLTSVDAITGGEIENVIDSETGFLLNGSSDEEKLHEIKQILKQTVTNKKKLLKMRKKAFIQYHENSSLINMKEAFLSSFRLVIQ